MVLIKKSLDTDDKLAILSQDSQYDLACACGTRDDEHRRRSREGKWIYPVSLPQGGTTYLFKTLLSNECVNNCKYCPLRVARDAKRITLAPQEAANTFMSYYHARRVQGLFLSSGVMRNPDYTMERINSVALLLRKSGFRGYIHLKIIPGASDAAIRQSIALSTAVSLNIETAGENNFKQLSTAKNYERDIMRSMRLISELTSNSSCHRRVHQTTQFVVGASNETDKEIIDYSWKLYKELRLHRIYFSAYQRGLGTADLPGERSTRTNAELLNREHRLYQVDWLIRKYGFSAEEIPLENSGNLSLGMDPKEMWARLHPECFPVNINHDDRFRLLRVPGLGQITVERILSLRNSGAKFRSLSDIGKAGKVLKKAQSYVKF